MNKFDFDLGAYFTMLAFLIPILILAGNWILEYFGLKSNKRKREEANASFEKVVESLSSDNTATQLSAAVLLRRYLTLKIGNTLYLHKETIDVISSILRTLPTGVYQKTLADGLAYAADLTNADLQRTNLQNVYLGSKSSKLKLHATDLFMSNLAHGLIDNVDARHIILYDALLYGTIIKNSDFSYANFVGADLTNAKFKNVILKNADFSKATNIPKEIKDNLIDNIYTSEQPVNTTGSGTEKIIFFSMPGNMSKSDEMTVLAYRQYLTSLGYDIMYYNRDTYPRFGQLTKIKASIAKCAAMIAFGTKQTFIKEGVYRPGMNGERQINNEWLSTPWNDIEVGMATMTGIPVLLVKDGDVENGIFDNVISESFIHVINSNNDINKLDKNQVLSDWLSKIA